MWRPRSLPSRTSPEEARHSWGLSSRLAQVTQHFEETLSFRFGDVQKAQHLAACVSEMGDVVDVPCDRLSVVGIDGCEQLFPFPGRTHC